MMKQGFVALKSGDWEEYKGIFGVAVKATDWAFDRIREAFEQLAQDEAAQLSIVQELMIRKHGLLATHHRVSGWARRRYDVILVPALQQFPFGRLNLVGIRERRAHQLVVRELWREIRSEATKQAFGRTNR